MRDRRTQALRVYQGQRQVAGLLLDWTNIDSSPVSSVAGLVVGDFDGDGFADVAHTQKGFFSSNWEYTTPAHGKLVGNSSERLSGHCLASNWALQRRPHLRRTFLEQSAIQLCRIGAKSATATQPAGYALGPVKCRAGVDGTIPLVDSGTFSQGAAKAQPSAPWKCGGEMIRP
jgi:hypothetical protein